MSELSTGLLSKLREMTDRAITRIRLRLDGLLLPTTTFVWNGRFWSCLAPNRSRGLLLVLTFRPAERTTEPPGEPESEWLAKQFAAAARSNVKFYMDVGLLEGESTGGAPLNWLTMVDQPIPYGPSLLLANRHMRDILRLKGYQVHYAEFSGGHNALSWRGTFGDALMLAAASGLDRELREDVTMKAIDGPVARLTSTGVGTPLHRSGPSIPQSDHRHPSSIPRSR